MWFGIGKLSTSIPFLGAALWVDTTMPGILVAVLGDARGLVRVNLPIPSGTPANISVHMQMVFNQTSCNVPLFASGGLTITTR